VFVRSRSTPTRGARAAATAEAAAAAGMPPRVARALAEVLSRSPAASWEIADAEAAEVRIGAATSARAVARRVRNVDRCPASGP
jgi:hypothetical protein